MYVNSSIRRVNQPLNQSARTPGSKISTRAPLGQLRVLTNVSDGDPASVTVKKRTSQLTPTPYTTPSSPAHQPSHVSRTPQARIRSSNTRTSPPRSSPRRSFRSKYQLLIENVSHPMLQAQDPCYNGKLVVVLDLDETLAYGRTFGQPKLRPHLHKFLQTLQELECEVVLWTAGEKGYALAMLDIIDPHGSLFQHCVYRHPRWWSGPKGHIKDLTLLGRPLERTFIVENTPDCVRECEANAILVSDYVGPGTSMLSRAHADHVLDDLTQCVQAMWADLCSGSVTTVADALQRSTYLMQRTVGADHTPCAVTTWTLRSDAKVLMTNPPPPVYSTSLSRHTNQPKSFFKEKLNVSFDSTRSRARVSGNMPPFSRAVNSSVIHHLSTYGYPAMRSMPPRSSVMNSSHRFGLFR